MLVVDDLHDFGIGVPKRILAHPIRIFYSVGPEGVRDLKGR